ncbi:regulatory signaling modulator protein AmpE [Salinimonas lutimaris]|uniref:regulatory signaling modulator protein AmpE n=1 Tax=Salinimonas lutimaris TaxID=914153 RepID=UPI0010BF9459|nr:regulatory signaling modulator protein AmpE [Salinimonas lutimaris]
MMLMSLLLALLADRYWPRHTSGYLAAWYARLVPPKTGEQPDYSTGQQILIMLLPALLLGGMLWLAESFLLTFVVQTLVLILALGKVDIKRHYRRYLEAGQRGDTEAQAVYLGMLTQRQPSAETLDTCMAKCLLWLSYRYYSAPIIVFVLLGLPGLLLYCGARYLSCNDASEKTLPGLLLFWLDLIPVRIATCGFLLVGHFANATSAWLKGLLNFRLSAQHYLINVGQRAEELDSRENNLCTRGALRLARRNNIFLAVFTAVLTLSGIIL